MKNVTHHASRITQIENRTGKTNLVSKIENVLGRNPTERLLKIHQALAAQRFPNTFRLAKEFEVSPRTIKRDVQWMKDHWDLPIAYNRSRRGYYYSKPVDQFPGVPTVT